mmetsp:Transcript_9702/g.16333  ORF Transcript_9702/g.16333 Transcript_9702/m.16333 type:complete len:113 (-) Transcript_9702:284-622(-)
MFKDVETIKETKTSRDIRILSEVEKIWILYDLDMNGSLELEEIQQYLREMAFPHLTLSDDQVQKLFDSIDENGDREVTKEEMGLFIGKLIEQQKNLSFKKTDKSHQPASRKK